MATKARLRLDGADPINKGLVGFWPLTDGAGGRARDISPYRQTGTLTNFSYVSGSGWGSAQRGPSIFTDGTDDYVNVGQPIAQTGNFSAGCWFKYNTADRGIFGRGLDTASPLDQWSVAALVTSINTLQAYVVTTSGGAAGYGFTGTTTLVAGQWYHVVIVYEEGGTLKGYLNGREEGNASLAGTSILRTASSDVFFGRSENGGGAGRYLNGAVNNARVYRRVLRPSEIARLYRDPWAGTLRTRRRGYSAANAYSLTLDNVSREYGAGALGLTAARRLALDGVSRVYGAGAANLTVARALALDGVSRVYGAGDITLTKTRPMALDGVSRLYGADDMVLTYDGTGAGPHGVLRRRVRRRLWNDVPEDLKPVVALAEEWADESPVQRAVDEALDRYARISARASVARRDRLVDELKRAIVQAVERAAEADDEEALIALL